MHCFPAFLHPLSKTSLQEVVGPWQSPFCSILTTPFCLPLPFVYFYIAPSGKIIFIISCRVFAPLNPNHRKLSCRRRSNLKDLLKTDPSCDALLLHSFVNVSLLPLTHTDNAVTHSCKVSRKKSAVKLSLADCSVSTQLLNSVPTVQHNKAARCSLNSHRLTKIKVAVLTSSNTVYVKAVHLSRCRYLFTILFLDITFAV